MGLFNPKPREAAVRIKPDAPAEAQPSPLPESSTPQSVAFDPSDFRAPRASDFITDPIYHRIGLWRDHQSHGRVTYDVMLSHPEVSSAFHTRLAFLAANRPHFRPSAPNPTPKQKLISDYANHILTQLEWTKFIDGPIGQMFQYGFTLSEISTKTAKWRGMDVITLSELTQLPQATLDHGFIPREEFGELALDADPRYRCFSYNNRGSVTAFHQFGPRADTDRITWSGNKMKQILHAKLGGGDGNPHGRSVLSSAFYPWSELYATEQIEGVHRDTSLPFLFGTYRTPNNEGIARPAVHDGAKDALESQGPAANNRFLMWADGDLKSVSPSNADFTNASEAAKARLTRQLWKAMLTPQSLVSESSDGESDVRNLVSVYFKHLLKADLAEVSLVLETLSKRLIDSNFKHLDTEDYPVANWSVVTENELRVAQAILTQALPYTHHEKLGELLHRIAPAIYEADMVPANHADSVDAKRPRVTPEDPTKPGSDPPPKQPGEDKVRDDGQTENPSGVTDNAA